MKAFILIAAGLLGLVAISEPIAKPPVDAIKVSPAKNIDPIDDAKAPESSTPRRHPVDTLLMPPTAAVGYVRCKACNGTGYVRDIPGVNHDRPAVTPNFAVQPKVTPISTPRPVSRVAKAPVMRAAGYWREQRYGFRGRRVQRVWVSTQPQRVYQQPQAYCPPGAKT